MEARMFIINIYIKRGAKVVVVKWALDCIRCV